MAQMAELTKSSIAAGLHAPRETTCLQVRLRALILGSPPGVLSLEVGRPRQTARLPPFEPGSHIRPSRCPTARCGNIPLCGDPNDTSHYIAFGIRGLVSGGLSSSFVHGKLRPGETAHGQRAAQQFFRWSMHRAIFSSLAASAVTHR